MLHLMKFLQAKYTICYKKCYVNVIELDFIHYFQMYLKRKIATYSEPWKTHERVDSKCYCEASNLIHYDFKEKDFIQQSYKLYQCIITNV